MNSLIRAPIYLPPPGYDQAFIVSERIPDTAITLFDSGHIHACDAIQRQMALQKSGKVTELTVVDKTGQIKSLYASSTDPNARSHHLS